MRGQTFSQVVAACQHYGTTMEQISLRKMVLRNGHLRWNLHLLRNGRWWFSRDARRNQ